MRLRCPHCGLREVHEFEFRRVVEEPRDGEPGDERQPCEERTAIAYSQIYARTNRVDSSREYWQHVDGCRAWLVVHRNPSTAEVLDVRFLNESFGGDA